MKFLKEKSNYSQAVKILFIFDNLAKILNFAKNIIITAALGFTKIPDAFNLSRSINGTFYNTISNALLAGTLPYLNEREDIQEKINVLYSLVILIVGFFSIISILIIINFNVIIDVLAPGFDGEQKKLVYIFFLLQLPLSIITVFTNAFESYFRSEQIFGITNVIKFFISVIAFLLMFFFIKTNYYFLAIGPLVGTVLGFIYFLSLIPKKMTRFDKGVFSVIKFALPLVLGGSFTIINSFVDKGFSSTLPTGQLTTMDLAGRLLEQIKGLVAGPIIGALYAFISLSITKKEFNSTQERLTKVTNTLITLFSIIYVIYILWGKWGLSLIFEHGMVESENVKLLFEVTLILLPLCFSLQNITILVLYSFKNAKLPTITGIVSMALNIVLNYIFVKRYGIFALVSSTLLVVLVNAFICAYYVKIKYHLFIYTKKHLVITITTIISGYSTLIFNNYNIIPTIFAVVIIGELLIFKLLSISKLKSLTSKFMKKQ